MVGDTCATCGEGSVLEGERRGVLRSNGHALTPGEGGPKSSLPALCGVLCVRCLMRPSRPVSLTVGAAAARDGLF